MNPKHLHVLSMQMFAINNWCIEASKGGVDWILFKFETLTTSVVMTLS